MHYPWRTAVFSKCHRSGCPFSIAVVSVWDDGQDELSLSSEVRMQVPHGADAFEQRSQVQDRGLRLPLAYDLHFNRQPFLARTEPHRQAGQAGDVERHGRALEVGGVHGLAVDFELLDSMLVSRDP